MYVEWRWTLALCGSVCIVVLMATATMYYGNFLYGFLPVMQKLTFGSCIAWLLAVYYARMRATSSTRADSIAPATT
jgi:hypothetical protein